jgi:hypothetical protein
MTAPQLTDYSQGVGAVSADGLTTFQQTCNTFSDLRSFTGVTGSQVATRGGVSVLDGLQGTFYWLGSSTAPDDGINTIVPTGAAQGAWIRIPVIANLTASDIISCAAIGTNALVLTPFISTQQPASYTNYQVFAFTPPNTSTGAVTAQVGGLSAYPVYLQPGLQAGVGNFSAGGGPYFIAYGSTLNGGTSPGFLMLNLNSFSLNNPQVTFTSGSPTVLNAYNGATIGLGGNAIITLTFNNPSTYSSNFICTVANIDAYPGGDIKLVVLTGVSTIKVYPGQSYVVYSFGGVWQLSPQIPASSISPTRWRPNVGINLYVSNSGSDTANGGLLPTTPLKTIGKAILVLYQELDPANIDPIINVANGTYSEAIETGGQPMGCGVFFIVGASPLGVLWQIPSAGTPYCFNPGDGTICEIQNIQFGGNNISGIAIQMHQLATVDILSGCGFGSFGTGTHIGTDGCGSTVNLDASYAINGAGGASVHVGAASVALVNVTGGITIAITNTPNIAIFYRVLSGGVISLSTGVAVTGSTVAGGQKWSVGPAGALFLSGNASVIPGTVAGAPATGAAPTGTTGWATA